MLGLRWLQTLSPKRYERIYRLARHIDRLWYKRQFNREKKTVDMISASWDTLILLDGCRADTFRNVVGDKFGEVQTRISTASESSGFIDSTFEGRDLSNTVYVTANPHVHELSNEIFHAVVNVADEFWNEENGTVLPEDMTNAAIQAHEIYPDKRIIVHYMQPHFPFIGDSGSFDESDIKPNAGFNPWQEEMWGDPIGQDKLISAYEENLELTIPHVERLIGEISGRIIISSDHANLLGEWALPIPIRVYGHPEDFYHPELVKIPWVVAKNQGRREIESGAFDVQTTEASQTEVENQLEALGYI